MAELATMRSGYPVALTAEPPQAVSRFWAIPLLGIVIKSIILIPHIIILYVLSFIIPLVHLVIWIPVLINGRYPDWAFTFNAGQIRWYARVTGYVFGLSDDYPAFSFEAPDDLQIDRPDTSSRVWAIPIVGYVVKLIILIPHFIVLYVLALAVAVCQLVIWIQVIFSGLYPSWAHTLNAGFILWTARISAFFYGLTDEYPPFSMT
jgi:Domain of unknown function (DUF4389)